MAARPETTKVKGFLDIETTETENGAFACAYTVLKIDRLTDEENDNKYQLFRRHHGVLKLLQEIIDEAAGEYTPVIASYNLRFDFAPLAYHARQKWQVREFTGSDGRRLFCIDLWSKDADADTEPPALRFWNVQPLVPEGLAEMGRLAGVEKKEGAWDYELQRSPETPLTGEEVEYCLADVVIIRDFLRWLLKSFDWCKPGDLGRTLLTPASIARLYQQRVIAPIRLGKKTVGQEWHAIVSQGKAREEANELRREAYAGGYTFTNPAAAFRTIPNITHLDIDSAYHFGLVSLPVAYRFGYLEATPAPLASALNERIRVLRAKFREGTFTPDDFNEPFGVRFHARVSIEGLKGRGFTNQAGFISARRANARARAVLNATGDATGRISATGAKTRFGRIAHAKTLTLTVDEYELASLALAYDFDAVTFGPIELASRVEPAHHFTRLCSFALRAEKNRRKRIGGTQYDFFKRIYNSQAGIYAERDRAGFSNAYLPVAVRLTSFARLVLLTAASLLDSDTCSPISGDTDSLKIRAGFARAAKTLAPLHSALAEMRAMPTAAERAVCEGRLELPEDTELATLGEFVEEGHSVLHRELGPKMRAWTGEDGTLTLRMAGYRTGKLVKALNDSTLTPSEKLECFRPWTWIDMNLVKRVQANEPANDEPRWFSGVDRFGKEFEIKTTPAISLKDSQVCIMSPSTSENYSRLRQAGVLDALEEGYLYAHGWRPM